MNKRTTVVLTGMTLLGLAIAALPQVVFAHSDPWLGTWQFNLTKSKFSPGPPPPSHTMNVQAEGQNHKYTFVRINAEGNPISDVIIMHIYDGMPHPVTGNPDFDARSRRE
jgi:hypothetical protein